MAPGLGYLFCPLRPKALARYEQVILAIPTESERQIIELSALASATHGLQKACCMALTDGPKSSAAMKETTYFVRILVRKSITLFLYTAATTARAGSTTGPRPPATNDLESWKP